ncbi:TIGR03086 family protein [Actinomadura darangshiensis]|uniref:TIGR03086 family protein n=1 Tax=Actinomadura darangshiensis TaxID=705336 RepID=A0A4R5BDI9_9ACTN|nr:TIGR03086 family metal-binding protein [Actinomadura darangshiensis]TDD83323.1 TIGR03086 family protein [Actinomadura darangshiensis]
MRERTHGPRPATRGGLLEEAIGFVLAAVQPVAADMLARPTPCEHWDLGMLLAHVGESLAALHEGMRRGDVATVPAQADPVDDPVSALRVRAVRLLKATCRRQEVAIGDRRMAGGLLAVAGALEVAVHGWDISQATREGRPIPPALADELLPLAPLVLPEKRDPLFAGPVDPPPRAGPGDRLVALLGRRPLR